MILGSLKKEILSLIVRYEIDNSLDDLDRQEGVVLFPDVILNTVMELDNNIIMTTEPTIDDETIIGNQVLISAGIFIGSNSRIDDSALLAHSSKVISGVKIDEYALVADVAVVLKDVNPKDVVYGIPAKVKK